MIEPGVRRSGRAMPIEDSLIAATALAHDLAIVTLDRPDFEATGRRSSIQPREPDDRGMRFVVADAAASDKDVTVSWRIRGSYFESCNCDAICPCRRIDGVAGGRSTHGECLGVLSWLIEQGSVAGVDMAGQPVAMAIRYSDDEEGSPWTWILYLDVRASDEQRAALEDVFRGRLGGDQYDHFPWVRKANEPVAVRAVEIDVDHTRRRQLLRVRDSVSVRIRDRYEGDETVTCVIPGHDRSGEELVADELVVEDGPLGFRYRGTCGYGSSFDYAGKE